jgi:toxin ParE1/3/4
MGRPRFTEQAAADYAAAARWHESEREGRGKAFALYIEAALDHIEHRPEAFPTVWLNFQRIVVRQFPYVLFYRVEAGQVVVHAVFHTSLNPSILRGRLGDA